MQQSSQAYICMSDLHLEKGGERGGGSLVSKAPRRIWKLRTKGIKRITGRLIPGPGGKEWFEPREFRD